MLNKDHLSKVRNDIKNVVGTSFTVESGHGVRQKVFNDCVVMNTYNSVFTVQQRDRSPFRTMSFSYNDIAAGLVRFKSDDHDNKSVDNNNIAVTNNFINASTESAKPNANADSNNVIKFNNKS